MVLRPPTLHGMRKRGMLPIPSLLRVSFFSQLVGGFATSMIYGNEDYATWVRALERGARVKLLEVVASCYRISQSSMMRSEPYVTLGRTMFTLHSPGLFTDRTLCHALLTLRSGFMKLPSAGMLLERAVHEQPLRRDGELGDSSLAVRS